MRKTVLVVADTESRFLGEKLNPIKCVCVSVCGVRVFVYIYAKKKMLWYSVRKQKV